MMAGCTDLLSLSRPRNIHVYLVKILASLGILMTRDSSNIKLRIQILRCGVDRRHPGGNENLQMAALCATNLSYSSGWLAGIDDNTSISSPHLNRALRV